jgi:hypothetical protein
MTQDMFRTVPGVCEIDCRLNPENRCQRNHSDTLARLIRRHDASETVLRESFGGPSRSL